MVTENNKSLPEVPPKLIEPSVVKDLPDSSYDVGEASGTRHKPSDQDPAEGSDESIKTALHQEEDDKSHAA